MDQSGRSLRFCHLEFDKKPFMMIRGLKKLSLWGPVYFLKNPLGFNLTKTMKECVYEALGTNIVYSPFFPLSLYSTTNIKDEVCFCVLKAETIFLYTFI